MAVFKCPYCGHENIVGNDHCAKCLAAFTQKDILQPTKNKFQKKLLTEKVEDFISSNAPILVRPETTIQEMIDRMQANPTKGCVLVCDAAGNLVGIASIRDILLKVAGALDPAKTPVSRIMTSKPECVQKGAPLSFALHKMSIGKFRHVPVVDEKGKPIGVVSTRDLIDYLSPSK